MSKQVDKLVVAVSLCLIAACWFLATEKTAQAQYQGYGCGYTCMEFAGERCTDTGRLACEVIAEDSEECDFPLCYHCDSCQVFPYHVCVSTPPYGYCKPTNTPDGPTYQCIGIYDNGSCIINDKTGYCDCYYIMKDTNCEDFAFLYYYCDFVAVTDPPPPAR